MHNFETVLDNADRHELLAVVASVHHERIDQSLDHGALGLAESLGGITPGAVGNVLGVLLLHGNVILQANKKAQISIHWIHTQRQKSVYIYQNQSRWVMRIVLMCTHSTQLIQGDHHGYRSKQ